MTPEPNRDQAYFTHTQFFDSVNSAYNLLDHIRVDGKPFLKKYLPNTNVKIEEYNPESNVDLSDYYLNILQFNNYNFLLFDKSTIQFQIISVRERFELYYCYFQFPYNITMEKFRDERIKQGLTGRCTNEDYYEYVSTEIPVKDNVIVLRYDYSESEYDEGIHSVSHIHICNSAPINITAGKLLSPYAFTFFVLKQVYHDIWAGTYKGSNEVREKFKRYKHDCLEIKSAKLSDIDKSELLLV